MKAWVIERLQHEFEDEVLLDEEVPGADFAITGDANWLSPTAFYVLDSKEYDVETIHEWLEHNTTHGIHSIFFVPLDAMPRDGSEVLWDRGGEWLKALHAVNYGRIYTYEAVSNRVVNIRPVHFEPVDGDGSLRVTMYGPEHILNLTDLKYKAVASKAHVMLGTFLIAMYKDGPFWKTQQKPPPKREQWKSNPYEYAKQRQRESEDFRNWWQRNGGGFEGEPFRQKERSRGAYEVIGISPECTKEEAKKAYRMKALELHPDRHPDAVAEFTALMQDLNRAWEQVQRMKGW